MGKNLVKLRQTDLLEAMSIIKHSPYYTDSPSKKRLYKRLDKAYMAHSGDVKVVCHK